MLNENFDATNWYKIEAIVLVTIKTKHSDKTCSGSMNPVNKFPIPESYAASFCPWKIIAISGTNAIRNTISSILQISPRPIMKNM